MPLAALYQRFFANVRVLDFKLNERPITVALCRVAPSVRFRDFAILASGSLRAQDVSAPRRLAGWVGNTGPQWCSKKAIQPTDGDSYFQPETNQRGRKEA
jgi:hypothetical protein